MFHLTERPDINGERHRWILVEEADRKYIRHERVVDTRTRSGTLLLVRGTATIEYDDFLFSPRDPKAKNMLLELLERSMRRE
jgi:hypothetical protein